MPSYGKVDVANFSKKIVNCSKRKVVEAICRKNMEMEGNCNKNMVLLLKCSQNMVNCSKNM